MQQYGEQANIAGDQYALGVRWQLPISKAWILRADAMYGVRINDDDIGGVRFDAVWQRVRWALTNRPGGANGRGRAP